MLEKAKSSLVWNKNHCKIISYFAKKGGQILSFMGVASYNDNINEKAPGAEDNLTLTVLGKCFIH